MSNEIGSHYGHSFVTPIGIRKNSPRLEPLLRRGLSESLQEFARRIGGHDAPIEKYRHSWALQGLRYLGVVSVFETWEKTLERIGDGPRIAPGIPVPTRIVNM